MNTLKKNTEYTECNECFSNEYTQKNTEFTECNECFLKEYTQKNN